MARIRAVEITRAAWGGALLLAPRWTMRTIHRIEVDNKSVVVARVLGARQLAQAALSGVRPSPEILALGVWVDLAHAASALGLAATDRERASAGLTDTAVALTWASIGWHDARHGPVPTPEHDRRRDAVARWLLAHLPGGSPLGRRAQAHRDTRRG